MLRIAGVSEVAGVGNEIVIEKQGQKIHGEILSVSGDSVSALLYSASDIIRIGDVVHIEQEARIEPADHWLGQIINYRGEIASDLPPGTTFLGIASASGTDVEKVPFPGDRERLRQFAVISLLNYLRLKLLAGI